jgi:transketolase
VDLPAVFTGFGWDVIDIDGHDFTQIFDAFDQVREAHGRSGRPTIILSRTSKGRGVSFTEGTYAWHNGVATAEQLETARRELGARTEMEVGA